MKSDAITLVGQSFLEVIVEGELLYDQLGTPHRVILKRAKFDGIFILANALVGISGASDPLSVKSASHGDAIIVSLDVMSVSKGMESLQSRSHDRNMIRIDSLTASEATTASSCTMSRTSTCRSSSDDEGFDADLSSATSPRKSSSTTSPRKSSSTTSPRQSSSVTSPPQRASSRSKSPKDGGGRPREQNLKEGDKLQPKETVRGHSTPVLDKVVQERRKFGSSLFTGGSDGSLPLSPSVKNLQQVKADAAMTRIAELERALEQCKSVLTPSQIALLERMQDSNGNSRHMLQRRVPSLKKFVLPLQNVDDDPDLDICKVERIGHGAASEVWEVTVNGWTCAMKEVRLKQCSARQLARFEQELDVMKNVPPHRNLCKYLGHLRRGDALQIFLTKYSSNLRWKLDDLIENGELLSQTEAFRVAMDVVRGLMVLV